MAGVLLGLEGVARAFGSEQALRGVDLTVSGGEVHALVGLNGAGKSTLMRLALGMLRPDRGTVAVDVGSGPVAPRQAPAATWAQVGHLIETPFGYPELTVVQTVRCAARLRGLGSRQARAATGQIVEDLALEHWAARGTRALSQGNRQRVGLACALVHHPRLLVLDEPSTALDPAGVLVVRRRLAAAAASGAGVLISSHHLDEMARIADRVTVLHRGAVIGILQPGTVDLERQFFDLVYAQEGIRCELP